MQYFNLSEIECKEPVSGFKARFVHSENITLAYWDIEAKASLPEHSHEQITNVIEGEIELIVDGEARILEPGSVLVVPPDEVHSGKAVTNCRIIDVFYPIREDYR